ncbi:MAG: hypothetical protein JXB32_05200 [Deltaproteobacteria bacterium]|nr:hypothetical protein [Deltaproteobacteria bacterium]
MQGGASVTARRRGFRGSFLPVLLVLGCAESTPPLRDVTETLEADDVPGAEDVVEAEAEGSACRPGQSDCGGTCVDLTTDPDHCGRCGHACAAGEVCNEGACASTCTGGLTNCDGACVDLTTDPNHCGDCTTICSRSEECVAGHCVCVPDCAGRACGDDGCGGSCGTCPAGTSCSDAGRCVCVPDCAGRACGDDGCGGSCGACGTGFVCTPAGTCSCPGTLCGTACCATGEVCLSGACCDATWEVETTTTLRAVVRDLDGTLYVAGSDGTQAYVAAHDACGVRLREQRFVRPTTATGSTLAAIALSGADVCVGGQTLLDGADPGNGLWARLPKTTLTPTWAVSLWGGGDRLDEIWSVGVTTTGNGWMMGTTQVDAPPTQAWVVRGYADTGTACGFALFPGETGGTVGRGLLLAGGRVYVTGTRAGQAVVTSFADDECGFTSGPCPCTPTGASATVEVAGASYTEVRALAAAGGSVYGAGFAIIDDDFGTLLARIAGTTVTFAPRWNPTAQIDAYTELAADSSGGALYAAGTRGWPGSGTTAGQGVLARYGAAGLTAEWQALLDDTYLCWDVLVDDGGGIVVACARTGSGSVLARCLPSGVCP